MSLEWFDRVCSEMQDNLESICEKYDEVGHMRIDKASRHPKIEFYVEFEEAEREIFCTLFFDPHNEEFYLEEFDLTVGETFRQILPDIEEILDSVHEMFHNFMEIEVEETDDVIGYEDDDIIEDEESDIYDDDEEFVMTDGGEYDVVVDVEWKTPEVLAYSYLDEIKVSYKFGVIKETGDGILHRVNKIYTDYDTIEDESTFIFSKEEAGTIVELIENNLDAMEGFDPS